MTCSILVIEFTVSLRIARILVRGRKWRNLMDRSVDIPGETSKFISLLIVLYHYKFALLYALFVSRPLSLLIIENIDA